MKKTDNINDFIRIIAEKGKEDFWYFTKELIAVDAGYKLITEKPHLEMCRKAEKWNRNKRIFLYARDTFKTTILVVCLCLWEIVRNPNIKILLSSVTLNNAKKSLNAIKNIIEGGELFKKCYGNLKKEPGWTDSGITVASRTITGAREQTIETGAIGSERVGHHYDLIMFDDPHDKDNIKTPTLLRDVIDYYKGLMPMLDTVTGRLQISGTRWHHQDVVNHCLTNEPENFDVYKKPAYWEENGRTVFYFPSRLTLEKLNQRKMEMGSYMFSCQYMLDPIDDENAPFKKEWLRYIDIREIEEKKWVFVKNQNEEIIDRVDWNDIAFFVSIDPAGRGTISEQRLLDYTGVVVVGIDRKRRWFITEAWRKRHMRPLHIIEMIVELYYKYKPEVIGVEEATYQGQIQEGIERKISEEGIDEYIYVKELKHKNRAKNDRIKGLSPLYEYGRIYHAKGLYDLEDEMLRWSVSSTVHDDIIDALAYVKDIAYIPDSERAEAIEKLPALHESPGLLIKASEEYEQAGCPGTFRSFLDGWTPSEEQENYGEEGST